MCLKSGTRYSPGAEIFKNCGSFPQARPGNGIVISKLPDSIPQFIGEASSLKSVVIAHVPASFQKREKCSKDAAQVGEVLEDVLLVRTVHESV